MVYKAVRKYKKYFKYIKFTQNTKYLLLLLALVVTVGSNKVRQNYFSSAKSLPSPWQATYYLANGKYAGVSTKNIYDSNDETINDLDITWGKRVSYPIGLKYINFKVTFNTKLTLPQGTYLLKMYADDSAGLYLNDKLINDQYLKKSWQDVTLNIPQTGEYSLAINYLRIGGQPQLKLLGLDSILLSPPPAQETSPPPIVEKPAVAPTAKWEAKFYNATGNLSSTIADYNDGFSDTNRDLKLRFGNETPYPTDVDRQRFSALFTNSLALTQGTYNLTLFVDDWAQIWLNDLAVTSKLGYGSHKVTLKLPSSGTYNLKVDYGQTGGAARLDLLGLDQIPTYNPPPIVEKPAVAPTAKWEAKFYNATGNLSSTIADYNDGFSDTNRDLKLRFGNETPYPTDVDRQRFSALFTNSLALTQGTYNLTLFVDDWAQIWLNDLAVTSKLGYGSHKVTLKLPSSGTYNLKVDYGQTGGAARLDLLGLDQIPTYNPPPIVEKPDNPPPNTALPDVGTPENQHTVNLLLVTVDPPLDSGTIYSEYLSTLANGVSLHQAAVNSAKTKADALNKATEGVVNYQIAGYQNITTFPPMKSGPRYSSNGFLPCLNPLTGNPVPDWCEENKWKVDYVKFFQESSICEEAAKVNADEIWMLSPDYVLAYESFMVGPTTGFWVNGPTFIVPECQKQIIVMGTTWRPDASLHMYGHRVESVINYFTAYWKGSEIQRHWLDFAVIDRYYEPKNANNPPTSEYCGNVHFPHNAVTHYNYNNDTTRPSACQKWQEFPNYTGKATPINCTAWGCSDEGWQLFWLGSLPSQSGTANIYLTNGRATDFTRDWWTYILDPNEAIRWVKDHD